MRILDKIKVVKNISIVKTLWYNYKLFGFRKFFKCKLIIGANVEIRSIGKIEMDSKMTGRIHIGSSPLFNSSIHNYTVFNNLGLIKIFGKVNIQPGCIIYTSEKGIIEFRGNNRIGARTQLLARKYVEIGSHTGLSWDCQVCDTDFHYMKNLDTGVIKRNQEDIRIGSSVWIGNHVIIGKGVRIADGCIVAQNTYVNKSIEEKNKLIYGLPAKIFSGNYQRIWNLEKEQELNNKL